MNTEREALNETLLLLRKGGHLSSDGLALIQSHIANKPEAEPVAKYTGMGKIKWLKDGEMSLNQLLYTSPPSTAALQKRIEELEAGRITMLATARKMSEDTRLSSQQRDAMRGYYEAMLEMLALKAGDVQAPKEVVASVDIRFEGNAPVVIAAAPTDTEGK